MATRQSSIRLPERSWEQVAALAAIFGDNTKVLILAVDRMFREELGAAGKTCIDEDLKLIWSGAAGKHWPHICPADDRKIVFVAHGQPCPNGCGWIAQPEK